MPKAIMIIAFAPALREASFYGATGPLRHSTTIKHEPLSKIMKDFYPSLEVS
jgi:hypothetical protein